MCRGEAAKAVKEKLEQLGNYIGEIEQEEDVLVSKQYLDIIQLKKLSDLHIEKSEMNLRKPFIIVTKDEDYHVPMSADINVGAADNKFVAEVLGRTGAYCTACKSEACDMVGTRAHQPYYMDCGVKDVREIFEDNFVAAYGDIEKRTEADMDMVLPSARGDYKSRFGAKHGPMTDSIETTKVSLTYVIIQIIFFIPSDNFCPALLPAQHMDVPDELFR